MKSNTMLKHLGVCRAAGGEKPPKSEGGGSERQRARGGNSTFRKSLCHYIATSGYTFPDSGL